MSEPSRDPSPAASGPSNTVPSNTVASNTVASNTVEPIRIDTAPIVVIGLLCWLVALVVTLIVPSLHGGDRDWWPWACVSGLALGLIGLAYILRGRGNAAGSR